MISNLKPPSSNLVADVRQYHLWSPHPYLTILAVVILLGTVISLHARQPRKGGSTPGFPVPQSLYADTWVYKPLIEHHRAGCTGIKQQ